MADNLKSLAKDTAIYGVSSILGRILNWCLTPLHVYIFTNPVEYGMVNQLYGFTAVFMVLLTYGMETGFFRFINSKDQNAGTVYASSMISLGVTSLLFILLSFAFITPISGWLKYTDNPEHILMMFVTVALDAFMCIPFAYLRYKKRPIRFASLKLAFIFLNIGFNLLFLVVCPWLMKTAPALVDWFYSPSFGIGYIFLANLLSTSAVLLLLLPHILEAPFEFDRKLLKKMLMYSFPLLILGIAGVVNQTVSQITYPYLFNSVDEARSQMGIYGACLKITVIITMFTQAFRYAYEPFIFAKNKDKNNEDANKKSYADAMKYFILFSLLVFVGVMYYMDILKYIVSANYIEGVKVVPIAMLGEIFFGIYFNLSVWYKITDNTRYGAYFSVLGCVIQVLMNIVFVPMFGYIASAWATLICNLVVVLLSFLIGQKYYPIRYDMPSISFYFIMAAVFYILGMYVPIENEYLRLGFRTLLLFVMLSFVAKKTLPTFRQKDQ
ncbi:MAG: polysaccharide biosynthesis protein [Bacteroidetes bacterium]|jgi:O-antigen/teichoic acid export membrane protein|nr:polysaccharide biosynthesis protein [Bacteroidota bacterium]